MAGSFKRYIMNKLGLLRSLSTDRRNGSPNIPRDGAPSKPPASSNAVQHLSSGSEALEAGDDQSNGSDFHEGLVHVEESPLSSTRRNSAFRSPRQAPRRFFQRPGVLEHSRVSPARRRPPSPSRDLSHLKVVRNRRLMKEYREITRNTARQSEPAFTVELVNDCLYEWNIHLYHIDRTSDLWRDMRDMRIRGIQLNMAFPENFPFSPPFMRVLSPRIERGFVMEGGAICMELLTPRGWASAYTIEAIVMQFAASLVKGQGRIDRHSKKPKQFSKRSAESSFKSIVKTHEKYGWVTPPLNDG